MRRAAEGPFSMSMSNTDSSRTGGDSCGWTNSARLSRFHDNRLPAALRRATSLHVARCVPCRARLRWMESMGDASRALPSAPATVGLAERVRWADGRSRVRSVPRTSMAAAVAALVLASLLGLERSLRHPEPPLVVTPGNSPRRETPELPAGVRLAPVLGAGQPLSHWRPGADGYRLPPGRAMSEGSLHELAGGAPPDGGVSALRGVFNRATDEGTGGVSDGRSPDDPAATVWPIDDPISARSVLPEDLPRE